MNWQLEDTYSYPLISPVVELLNRKRNGELTAAEVQAQIDQYKTRDFRDDVLKYLYRKEAHQQYSIGIEGGSAIASYVLSAGYDKDLQSLIGNSYERFTVHSDNTFRPLKKLDIHTSVFYTETRTKSNNPGGYGLIPGGFIATYYPYASLVNDAGEPAALPKDYRKAFLDTAGGGRLLDWSYRPLDELKYADNQEASRRLLLHASARYNFTGTLSAEVQYQYEVDNSTSKDYHSEATWYTRNMINMYSRVDGGSVTRAIPPGGIVDEGSATAQSHNLRGQLNYSNRWNKNEVNVIAGAELRQEHTTNNAFRAYGYSDNNLTSANIDYLNAYPTFNDLLGDYYIPSNVDFGDQLNRFVSVYGNASYSFDNRYLISGSARKDASNLFGVAANQKGVPLWSAGLGWNVSNENFYQFAALPFLKLRGSYGYSGNVNNSLSALTTLRYLGSSYLTNLPYSSVRNPPNPSLRWEKTGQIRE
ncbi:MAG: hypothetical protein ACTHJ5_09520 [Ilyomonas sp.]